MARLLPGIASFIGRLGGLVAQRSRAGLVLRTFRAPINPRSDAQQRARVRFSRSGASWHSLSDAEKAAWDAYAATFYAPRDGRDPAVTYTGQQAYTGARMLAHGARQAAASIVTVVDPPGATVVLGAQAIPQAAPSAQFSATWEVDGVPRTVAVTGITLLSLSQLQLTLEWDGGITATSPPDPTDQTSGEKWGIVVLASLSSQQVHGWQPQRRARVLVALPPVSSIGAWSPSDRLTLELGAPPAIADAWRERPLTGLAVRLSAFGVSAQSAQVKLLGEQNVLLP